MKYTIDKVMNIDKKKKDIDEKSKELEQKILQMSLNGKEIDYFNSSQYADAKFKVMLQGLDKDHERFKQNLL